MADPLLPIIDTGVQTPVRVQIKSSFLSQVCINNLYYCITPQVTMTPGQMRSLAEAIWAAIGVEWTNVLSASCEVVSVGIDDMGRVTEVPMVIPTVELTVPGVGAIAGETMPPHTSITLARQTSFTGRHGRGSIRLTGVPESAQTAGLLTEAHQDLMLLLTNALRATVEVDEVGLTPFDATPYLLAEDPVVPGDIRGAALISWITRVEVSTQRSRRYGRGI